MFVKDQSDLLSSWPQLSQVDDWKWSGQGKMVGETWRLLDDNFEIQDVRLSLFLQKLVLFFSPEMNTFARFERDPLEGYVASTQPSQLLFQHSDQDLGVLGQTLN